LFIPLYINRATAWCKQLAGGIRRTKDAWVGFSSNVENTIRLYTLEHNVCKINAYQLTISRVSFPFYDYNLRDQHCIQPLLLEIIVPREKFGQAHKLFYISKHHTYYTDKMNMCWLMFNMFSIQIPKSIHVWRRLGLISDHEFLTEQDLLQDRWLRSIDSKLKKINPELSAIVTGNWSWDKCIRICSSYNKPHKGTKATSAKNLEIYGLTHEDAVAIEDSDIPKYIQNSKVAFEYIQMGYQPLQYFHEFVPYLESSQNIEEAIMTAFLHTPEARMPKVTKLWEWGNTNYGER